MKIKVKFQVNSWGGKIAKITSQEKELILSTSDKVESGDFGVITGSNIEVANITDGGIEIITNGLVEYISKGKIDLIKDSHGLRFSISLGQTLKLVSQTMDSGFEILITPVEFIKD